MKKGLLRTVRSIAVTSHVACLLLFGGGGQVLAADQAKSIINSLDPKNLNDLIAMSKTQPDAALTSVTPVGANKFRFLFIWPASNSLMTYERVGRSFAERFFKFAESQKYLAAGYCISARNMSFGTAFYGDEELAVAYRDIEVRFQLMPQMACAGKYVSADDLFKPAPAPAPRVAPPPAVEKGGNPAEDSIKPFLPAPGSR
jgi:hypothetical protein